MRFVIRRRDSPQAKDRWEEFDIRLRLGMNVITALMDIAADPGGQVRKSHYAHRIRIQLPGRGLRFLRHADQRQGGDGLLGSGS